MNLWVLGINTVRCNKSHEISPSLRTCGVVFYSCFSFQREKKFATSGMVIFYSLQLFFLFRFPSPSLCLSLSLSFSFFLCLILVKIK